MKFSFKQKTLSLNVTGRGACVQEPRAQMGEPSLGPGQRPLLRSHPGSPLSVSRSLPLSLPALTQTPDIQVPATLESDHPVNLTCYVSAACKSRKPLTFSWTWGTVISLGPGTPHFSESTIIPHPWSHGSNITCQVTFPRFNVTAEMTIQLKVSCESELFWAVAVGRESGHGILGVGSWILGRGRDQKDAPLTLKTEEGCVIF